MPNQHKRNPRPVRLPGDLDARTVAYAAKQGRTVNSVIVEAVSALLGGATTTAKRPARGATTCPHPKARVHKGLCGACGTAVQNQ